MKYLIIPKSLEPHVRGGDRGDRGPVKATVRSQVKDSNEGVEKDKIANPMIAWSLPGDIRDLKHLYEEDWDTLRKQEKERASTWGIRAIGADGSNFSGKGVTVAILDTGIDKGHLAFAGLNLKCRNFVNPEKPNDINIADTIGHGTHTAATVFGQMVDDIQIGVAPGIRNVLIGKVLGNDGKGSNNSIFDGLMWAVKEGADIILMSLGFDIATQQKENIAEIAGKFGGRIDRDDPAVLAQASWETMTSVVANTRFFDSISSLFRTNSSETWGQKPPLIIAASGNSSRRRLEGIPCIMGAMFPAAAQGIISVAAVKRNNEDKANKDDKNRKVEFEIAEFSNGADLAAPGVNILSANSSHRDDGHEVLRYDSGTSMAAPHIAGLAALWMEYLKKEKSLPKENLAEAVWSELIGSKNTIKVKGAEQPGEVIYGIPQAP